MLSRVIGGILKPDSLKRFIKFKIFPSKSRNDRNISHILQEDTPNYIGTLIICCCNKRIMVMQFVKQKANNKEFPSFTHLAQGQGKSLIFTQLQKVFQIKSSVTLGEIILVKWFLKTSSCLSLILCSLATF